MSYSQEQADLIKENTELIVDNFAGGGGASTGIEMALKRPIDIAINHDPLALAMHKANHPNTKHFCENVWDIDPVKVCKGRKVGVAWFSPDCTHHSKARGGKPKNNEIRGLAWVALRWASTVKPRIIFLENVEEFLSWCPLIDGVPDKSKTGQTFNSFVKALNKQGYKVDWKLLSACNYGAPTTRKRLFLVARCDEQDIKWAEHTHGDGLKPYRTISECIDWSVPGRSIFNRKRPLADRTIERIKKGLIRYANCSLENDKVSFITEHANASSQRNFNINEPLRTICASVKGGHFALVRAFIVKYYGTGGNILGVNEPLHTITTKDRFALVMVKGEKYKVTDIEMRMLSPRELFTAQGFPIDYKIDIEHEGWKFSKVQQVHKVGNSVSPLVVKALVKANTVPQIKLWPSYDLRRNKLMLGVACG